MGLATDAPALERPIVDTLDSLQLNLHTTLDLLEGQDIEHFVVRGTWATRPVFWVPRSAAADLAAALGRLAAKQPVYLKTKAPARSKDQGLVRPSSAFTAKDLDDWFVLFTDLRDQTTGRTYGPRHGCEIVLWAEDDHLRQRTHPRAANPHVVSAAARRERRPVTVYGRSSTTYAPLDHAGIFDVRFPIDVVYMWVNGGDPAWQERKADRLGVARAEVQSDAQHAFRFRQLDELRYSLRSLERFAPWVRNIFLVTDRQRPAWLHEAGTNLTVIDHTEIIPASALPTFNSHALTGCLHNIPGLADHFIVMNDDVFFGRPIGPERLFHSNGTTQFFLSATTVDPNALVPHAVARLRTCDLIESMIGSRPTQVMKHTPVAFNRVLLAELAEEFEVEWTRTVHNPFRDSGDLVPEYLHHYLGYARKLTSPGTISYRYFGFGEPRGMDHLGRYKSNNPVDVFCVNDLGSDPDRFEADLAELAGFFANQFPYPSRYEG